MYIVHNEKSN